jgi:hypothetical protein
VPEAWVGLVHHLLTPLLFTLLAEPLTERLRAGSVGAELCAGKDFTRCLLLADDTCLTASSPKDLQRVLNTCSQWAADTAAAFDTRESHLSHLSGTRPDANTVLLSGEPLEWTQEV